MATNHHKRGHKTTDEKAIELCININEPAFRRLRDIAFTLGYRNVEGFVMAAIVEYTRNSLETEAAIESMLAKNNGRQ